MHLGGLDMGLIKYKLGELLELTTEINSENKYHAEDVRGMTITKEIIPTKADVKDADLKKFLVVHPREFVFNPRTHGKRIGFGFNDTNDSFLISWNNIAFRVKETMLDIVLPEFLFLHFNRSEWDREACYRSWGSSTEVFSWNALCDMELPLPSLEIQQKYVAIYKAMLANQQSYERGLEDLKFSIDASIEKYKQISKRIPLSSITEEIIVKNSKCAVTIMSGVNKDKRFNPTVANGEDISKYKLVKNNQFACNLMHVGRDIAVPIALNHLDETIAVSPAYVVFKANESIVLSEYLMIWFSRIETDRYAWYMCDSSVRSGMEKKRFFELDIPIPSLHEQKILTLMYRSLTIRQEINDRLKTQIKDICPILIKGAVEEGERG